MREQLILLAVLAFVAAPAAAQDKDAQDKVIEEKATEKKATGEKAGPDEAKAKSEPAQPARPKPPALKPQEKALPGEKPLETKPVAPAPQRPQVPSLRPQPPAKPVPAPQPAPPPPQLTMYNQRDFRGVSLILTEANSNIQFAARAIRVQGGPWQICARPFFGGRCDIVRSDNPQLNLARAFSGMVRSARPVDQPAKR